MSDRKLVGVDNNGNRVGEDHPKALLTNQQIDEIRDRNEAGEGYRTLARVYGCSKSTIRDIVRCRSRFATPTRWKSVRMDGNGGGRMKP